MRSAIAIVVFFIFFFIALLHFYWSLGGQWGKQAAIPTRNDGSPVIRPGFLPTFIVALTLSAFAMFSLTELYFFHLPINTGVRKLGFGLIGVIFFARAVGDFRYVGFLKKIGNTAFGRNDTKFYSPFCFMIGMLNGILAWTS
jgi:hypothetical protein